MNNNTIKELIQFYGQKYHVSDVVFELYHPVDRDLEAEWIKEFKDKVTECSFTPSVKTARYDESPLSEVTISCVDSMRSRRSNWTAVNQHSEVYLYIDARMGLETLAVHTVRPYLQQDVTRYAQSLHSDSASLQEPCTARTICYTPLMASSLICNLVKRYVNDEVLPGRIVFDLVTLTLMLPQF